MIFLTRSRRPASLQLPQVPRAVYSSPDGSCALVIQEKEGVSTVTAYHWTTFASTDGISITLPDFPVDLDSTLLTSIVNRNNIHLIGLDVTTQTCRSDVLDITCKATEFTFQEERSKAPTSHVLKGIAVSARTFTSFSGAFLSSPEWPASRFRAGEWLADLLCLIPIHVAITLDNRFVPLKDGVLSTQLEVSLLGAEVNRIVDSLSIGWYESIFQSYWASKVSSQS